MFKILISDKLGQAGLDVLNNTDGVSYDLLLNKSKEELIETLPIYDGWIVRSGTRPDADMIAAATNLKVIGRAGIGVDNIDVDAATEHGVIVMNTPGSNSMATAEQTFALMLATSRHTAHAHMKMAQGGWDRGSYMGQELYQKRLGIIGFGRVGRLVAKRAQAFGMLVMAHDPYVLDEDGRALGVEMVSLDALYAQADMITLHTAVTDETTQILDGAAFAKMKDGVIIINVARGKLINEADLVDALETGKVKAAGLDVFESEPPAADSPLINHPHVTHTPHLGASSVEAQRNVAVMVVEQVLDVLRGNEVRNAVNQT